MEIEVSNVGDNVRTCEIYVDRVHRGILYFERGKRGFRNKPIGNGWICVDAKVEGLYDIMDITPSEVVSICRQKIISSESL